jgi:hypothetical protein
MEGSQERQIWLMGIGSGDGTRVMVSCGGGGNPTDPATGGGNRELNSGDFGPGGRFEHRFANAGAFHYHCNHHSPIDRQRDRERDGKPTPWQRQHHER